MDGDAVLAIADERDIRGRIYVLRGRQVMLDSDLAEIYGYTTKAFNQQVRRNIEKFPDDFMFQLTEDELSILSSRSQIVTLNSSGNKRGANIKYLPHAFTEQGVYMLMTVLKGDLATRQSMALIRLFKNMKDCLADSQAFLSSQGYQTIVEKLEHHEQVLDEHGKRLLELEGTFDGAEAHGELLLLRNERFTADLAFQRIYGQARSSIILIDDYISSKTLQHLAHAPAGIPVSIISDNKGADKLRLPEFQDFSAEYPGRRISFAKSCGMVHDRYIVLDFGTDAMRVFHCGTSSKDAGSRMTSITELRDTAIYAEAVSNLLANPPLTLR